MIITSLYAALLVVLFIVLSGRIRQTAQNTRLLAF